MAAGWFAVAVHALSLLASSDDGFSSTFIAGSLNTHPVFLRRVLGRLAKVGIIEAREGREGGYRLARPADALTLAEIYRVIESEQPIAPSPAEPNPACPIGAGIRAALGEITAEVETGILGVLGQHTIADLHERAVLLGRQK